MALIPALIAGGSGPVGAAAGCFGLGCWWAFGVVFEGVFEFGVPFCVVFGVVFGVVLFCCACNRAPETAKPDTASRIKVPKILCVIRFLLDRSEVP
jgi:hypothetical protein